MTPEEVEALADRAFRAVEDLRHVVRDLADVLRETAAVDIDKERFEHYDNPENLVPTGAAPIAVADLLEKADSGPSPSNTHGDRSHYGQTLRCVHGTYGNDYDMLPVVIPNGHGYRREWGVFDPHGLCVGLVMLTSGGRVRYDEDVLDVYQEHDDWYERVR